MRGLIIFLIFSALPAFAQQRVTLEPHFARSEMHRIQEDDLYKQNIPMQRYSLEQESVDGEPIDVEHITPLSEASDVSNAITPQGTFLKFIHYGPYETIDQTYETIADYLDEHKLIAQEFVVEEFVKRPPLFKENQLVTNIYIQVK